MFSRDVPFSDFAGIGPADIYDRQCADIPLVTGGATPLDDGALAQGGDGVVLCQIVPWKLDYTRQFNLKMTYRRSSFLVARVLANMGVVSATPLLDHFQSPVQQPGAEKRWLAGLYLDTPQEWDDPYRFFGW